MRQVTRISLVFFVSIFALIAFILPVAAAPTQSSTQKTMKLQITIDDPNTFWNYPYINHQSEVLKPSFIAVEWSIGQLGHNQTKATIVTQGKATGELAIVTDKDALINLRVMVCDSKGNILGTSSGLEYNRGQAKGFTIAPPDFTEPKITIN